MAGENMQFPIPNSVLEPYIREAVSTAITGALGDGTVLISKAVTAALGIKVDHNGNVSRSDYDNKYNICEVVAGNKIREIARETINEMAEQMRPAVKAEVEKSLRKNHPKIAAALVDGLISSLAARWSVTVELGK